ncbi:MAG: helix-turn-helix transcriptional regulator [Atopobiaceae bacterium]|nr:helix-turn-helix transcriptional regulator [Atopobiaceae bacterium]
MGDDELFLLENSLCLICPGSPYELVANEVRTVVIEVCLRPSLFESGVFAHYLASDNTVSQTMRGQSPHRYLVISDTHDNLLRRSLRALVREYVHSEYRASFMVQGCALILLAQLAQIDTYSFFGLDRQMMEIVDYIHEHCDTVSVSSLAAQCGYSVAYFSRLVRSRCGMGANELIVSARLNRARGLLINSDLPIQDIASMVGYASYSHFNRIFRKTYRMSPAEYRSFVAALSRHS